MVLLQCMCLFSTLHFGCFDWSFRQEKDIRDRIRDRKNKEEKEGGSIMVWCAATGKFFPYEEECVSDFLKRNYFSLTEHTIVKIYYTAGVYSSQEVLTLSSSLEPGNDKHTYLLTQPEHTLNVYLNPYTCQFLRAETRKISLLLPKTLSVSSALTVLSKYFPHNTYLPLFSFFSVTCTPLGSALTEAKKGIQVKELSAVHLQPHNVFALARTTQASYRDEFQQLASFNSLRLFSHTYTVEIYSHFLFAQRKGSTRQLGQSIEITPDIKAYTQVIGKRSFAVIEKDGTQWTLYNKNPKKIEELLNAIAETPRYRPRDIEEEAERAQQKIHEDLKAVLNSTISNTSLPRITTLFPRDIPNPKDISRKDSPEVLLKKLELHLQRSIWDNVTIEFILYLLNLHSIPGLDQVHQEVRDFSYHRKRILTQLRDFYTTTQ